MSISRTSRLLLIGADIIEKLLTDKQKQLKCGIVALEALLGWTLIGKTNKQPKRKVDTALLESMLTQEKNVTDL